MNIGVWGVSACIVLAPMGLFADEKAKDKQWDNAVSLKRKGDNTGAVKAFLEYNCIGTNNIRKIEALVRAAECYDTIRQSKKARHLYERVIKDGASKRNVPEMYDEAHNLLHLHLHRNGDYSARERLAGKAVRDVSSPKIISAICEREADAQLGDGSIAKALQFYSYAPQLSQNGTNIVSILQKGNAKIENKDIRAFRTLCKAKPLLSEQLCNALSKCKEGWRIEDAYADILLNQGNDKDAIAIWDKLLKQRRGNEDEISAMRALAISAQDCNKGIVELEKWLSSHKNSKRREEIEVRLAHGYVEKGDYVNATNALSSFLVRNPKSPYCAEVSSLLQRTAERIKINLHTRKDNTNPIAEKLTHAEALLRNGKVDEALKAFQSYQLRKTDSNYCRYAYELGSVYNAKGDIKEAVKIWNRLWQESKTSTNRTYSAKARCAVADIMLEEEHNAKEAAKMYEEALSTSSEIGNILVFSNYAIALTLAGRIKDAEDVLSKHEVKAEKQGNTEDVLYWRNLASRLNAREIPVFDEKASNQYRMAYYLLRLADGQLSRYPKKALENYKRVAKLPVKEFRDTAIFGMANAYIALKDKSKALKTIRQFTLLPLSSSPLASRALLMGGTFSASPLVNDVKSAKEYFAITSSQYPGSKEAMVAEYYLATLAWKEKKWSEAEKLHRDFIV